jgi:flagellar hook-length control protein FliK
MTVQLTYLKTTPDLVALQKQLAMPFGSVMFANPNSIPTFAQILVNFMELLKTFDDNKPITQKPYLRLITPQQATQQDRKQTAGTIRQITPLQVRQKSKVSEDHTEKENADNQEEQIILEDNLQTIKIEQKFTQPLQKPIEQVIQNVKEPTQPHLTQITPPQQSAVEQIVLEENTNANQEGIPMYDVKFKQIPQQQERQFTSPTLPQIEKVKSQEGTKQNQEFYNYLLDPSLKTSKQNKVKVILQQDDGQKIQLPESQPVNKQIPQQPIQPQKDHKIPPIEHAKDVNLKIQDVEVHQSKDNPNEFTAHKQPQVDSIAQIASHSERASIQKSGEGAKIPVEKAHAIGEKTATKAQRIKLPQKKEPVNQQKRIEFIQRLVKAAKLARLKGYVKVKLMLHPPKLGNLRVDLQVKNKTLNGVLKVETNSAKEVILQNIETLKQELQKNGFSETYFNVLTFENKAGGEGAGDKAYPERQANSGFAGLSDSEKEPDTQQTGLGPGDKRIVDLIG